MRNAHPLPKDILLIGAPVDCGKRSRGCLMGPDAMRVAGLAEALASLGHRITDLGNLAPRRHAPDTPGARHYALNETIAWTDTLMAAARDAMARGLPIFLGGDHALALGTVAGVAAHAQARRVPQFVLWLDAHADFHTMDSTTSGHLHGTPLAYLTGRAGFAGFPALPAQLPDDHICILGLRSVDPAERAVLQQSGVHRHDMREIDEDGISRPLQRFLDRVAAANGALHVSLDVDFLDPSVAPGVVTTVPGGATVREAHLVMEMVCDSGLLTSLDIVELNPFLDDRGRTAQLMVDLIASGLGRSVFDRPTRAYM